MAVLLAKKLALLRGLRPSRDSAAHQPAGTHHLSSKVKYAYGHLSMQATLLDNRNCIMGLGGRGAHVVFILDAEHQTWLLSNWDHDQKRRDVADLIRRLTSDTAGAAGLHDREVLAAGKKAAVNVLDGEKLRVGAPCVVNDLPAGGQAAVAEGAPI